MHRERRAHADDERERDHRQPVEPVRARRRHGAAAAGGSGRVAPVALRGDGDGTVGGDARRVAPCLGQVEHVARCVTMTAMMMMMMMMTMTTMMMMMMMMT